MRTKILVMLLVLFSFLGMSNPAEAQVRARVTIGAPYYNHGYYRGYHQPYYRYHRYYGRPYYGYYHRPYGYYHRGWGYHDRGWHRRW